MLTKTLCSDLRIRLLVTVSEQPLYTVPIRTPGYEARCLGSQDSLETFVISVLGSLVHERTLSIKRKTVGSKSRGQVQSRLERSRAQAYLLAVHSLLLLEY